GQSPGLNKEQPMGKRDHLSRRQFVTDVALTGAAFAIVPRHVLGRGVAAPSDILNIAAVGVGGRGRSDLVGLASQNIVALCDVDWDYANKGFDELDANIKNQQERLDAPQDQRWSGAQGRPPLTDADRQKIAAEIEGMNR